MGYAVALFLLAVWAFGFLSGMLHNEWRHSRRNPSFARKALVAWAAIAILFIVSIGLISR